ncbi:MAG: hypothetical protein U9P79_04045 [Candidatus Cloacimonadota bacterium]|nr:hypothetical protein [Candidatus Cloacimonadota bacterium]
MTKKTEDSQTQITLCKARTNLELDSILDILNENNIPNSYQRKGLTIGPYFESVEANSFIEIYVFEEDAKRAQELIQPIVGTLE